MRSAACRRRGYRSVVAVITLAQLFAACAPSVGPVTMSALVAYESGTRPFAIGDNTARRSYSPSNRTEATRLVIGLLQEGHNIDAGYMQVNSSNFAVYGLDAASVFDPCTNVATGARILRTAYHATVRVYGPGQVALVHALSIYNTGAAWSGLSYARAVFATAGRLHLTAAQARSARGPRRAVAFRPHSVGTAPLSPCHAEPVEAQTSP
jgi:type IV secretion system protein VirB1